MREDIIFIMPASIQDVPKTTVVNNATENIEMQEADENAFYTDIMEFLRNEAESDAKRLDEWAEKRSSNPAKWLRIMKRRACNYCLVSGVLHHGRANPKRVVMHGKERMEVLKEAHVKEDTGIHIGVSKMYSSLCALYFWQGLYRDVKNFVRNCGNCVEIPTSSVVPSFPVTIHNPSEDSISDAEKLTALKVRDVDPSVDGQMASAESNCESHLLKKNSFVGEESEVWKKVEINVLVQPPTEGQERQSLLVLADPVSHWISAQTLALNHVPVNASEPAAMFAFSTFCTLGFPSVCSVVEDSGLRTDAVWDKMRYLMKPIKFDSVPETEKASKAAVERDSAKHCASSPPTLLSLAGISLEQEGPAPCMSPITLQSTSLASSSCKWAWELLKTYMHENADSWHLGLDAFLFEQRQKTTAHAAKSAFIQMFGRAPLCGGKSVIVNQGRDVRSKRRKLRSSIFKCRHCEENFTSKISFQIHQKKHTQEAQLRGSLEDKDDSESVPPPQSSNSYEGSPQTAPLNDADSVRVTSDVPSKSSKKVVSHRSKSTSCGRRKTHLKISGVKKQYQKGISRLIALAQVSRGLAAKGVSEEIPRDSNRANFTAQTVASVRASLEAKRKKHIRRGSYQRYSPELREEIAKHALSHGINHAVSHFSSRLGGKPISESTIRNFVRAYCAPASHLPCLRDKEMEEEIGRFSAMAGTEAAMRYYSSRLGHEVKRGTVSRLRRAYLKKHPEEVSKSTGRKKNELSRRKRRFGALLRDEIGHYAAQHGVCAAIQHYSERLLFPVHERTITKFLKMYLEKENYKNLDNVGAPQVSATGLLDKSSCLPASVDCQPPLDVLNPSMDVLGSLHHNNEIDRVDQGGPVPHLMYGESTYAGLQHTLEQQVNSVGFHIGGPHGYEAQHSSSQVVLNQNLATGFCNSQELNYHSVQNYPNFDHPSMQVPIGSLGMEHVAETVNVAIHSSHQDVTATNVPMPHVTSPYTSMIVSHHSLIDSQNNSSNLQNSHSQVVMSQTETNSEQVSSPNTHILGSGDSSTLTTVLSSSSFVHQTKNQVMSTMLMSQASDRTLLVNADLSSLQKSIEGEIMPTYYPLTMAAQHSYQLENNDMNGSVQANKDHVAEVVCGSPQTLILGEALMPNAALENQNQKSDPKQMPNISGDKADCFSDGSQPGRGEVGRVDGCSLAVGDGVVEGAVVSTVSRSFTQENSPLTATPKGSAGKGDSSGAKRKKLLPKEPKKKCSQKSKRGNYNFFSPELRARIGRYAAEHGNLQAAKHFQAEVGRPIPESTIRGLRDKYVMKQMHIASASQSSEGCAHSQKQVTALGYAPRGRPMVLGKYDEVVQDCMQELVKSGEKVGSLLAITTARQVLTQYEPSLLEEYGGPIKLNNSWAKSFIKRIGLSNNS